MGGGSLGPPPEPPTEGENMAKYYRAKTGVNLPVDGAMVLIPADALVPAGSPVLKKLSKDALAEHFTEVEPGGGADRGFGPFDVEQATAAPGEKRGDKSTSSTRTTKK